jgi:hypothetical protein
VQHLAAPFSYRSFGCTVANETERTQAAVREVNDRRGVSALQERTKNTTLNLCHRTARFIEADLKNHSSLNFRARQQCLRLELSPGGAFLICEKINVICNIFSATQSLHDPW